MGLGCSAGGLEALVSFFGHVPADSGLGFVVVQHLDPARTSLLPELLQRVTALPVVEAVDGMTVCPGSVCVLPPNKNLSMRGGRLRLSELSEPGHLHSQVDLFLRALAEDQGRNAIAVILSGMGSDGVGGLRAIKDAGGWTLAQDPSTAGAASMPRSAIAAGVVDSVGPPDELPARIVDLLRQSPVVAAAPSSVDAGPATPADSLRRITALLLARCGNDFSLYKAGTLQRRIDRRIALHQLDDIASYLQYVERNAEELELLFRELLIGVTSFFRDPGVWDKLREDGLPTLWAKYPQEHEFRAWVPGCSTGEEAYSLAMAFCETASAMPPGPRHSLRIFATDLDADAIAKARKGHYPKSIAGDVGAQRLARYFTDEGDHYRVAKEVREMVIFAQHNITTDPPFTRLDVLTCRNLLIYFGASLQASLLPVFHYALKPDGLLVLGNAETVGHFEHLFVHADAKHHIYHRTAAPVSLSLIDFPALVAVGSPSLPMTTPPSHNNVGLLTDQLIQQNYAPAAVLVNAEGDIVYISGRTGRYLEPAAGRVNINIHAMARPGLNAALTGVIRKALLQSEPLLLRGIRVEGLDSTQLLDVTVQGLSAPDPLRGRVLIVFKEVAAPPPTPSQLATLDTALSSAELHAELANAREALRVLREDSQASLEELKSANEELQSTNEELQSTNEELTTSKEEMQSMNEEMRTVNAELQSKVSDLTWERNDMSNLLNSTEIATVFLDNQMHLRRFTAFATRVFKLIPSDIGRPLSDLVTLLDYPQFIADAEVVLRTLVFSEKEVGAADGLWYRVRIMPYRTQDNVIDGVVSTFVDITQTKLLEAQLRRLGVQS